MRLTNRLVRVRVFALFHHHDDGLTGFIVHDEGSAVSAVSRLDRLSPSAIRARFEQRFTARRMAEDYVALYRRMAVKSRPALRVVT